MVYNTHALLFIGRNMRQAPSSSIRLRRAITVGILCFSFHLSPLTALSQSTHRLLTEVPFQASFTDSIHMIFSPRFITESIIGFCDIRDHRVMIVNGATGSVRTIGRRGSGPGEFNTLGGLAVWPGQGMVVYDSMLFRLSLFNDEGVFQSIYKAILAAGMDSPHMYAIDRATLAIAPRHMSSNSPITDHIILLGADFDTVHQIHAPEPVLSALIDNPIGVDLSNVSIGAGVGGTILAAFHSDYRIRRYSKSGDLLWDSGSLDDTFRAPSIQLPEREGAAVTDIVFNGIEAIQELEGFGFISALWVYEGSGRGYLPPWFIDLRDQESGLITRIPVPDNLRVGDFYRDGDNLYVLMYHLGQIELPIIRIFRIDLKEVTADGKDY